MAKEEIRPCLVWVLLVRYCWARQKNNTAIPGRDSGVLLFRFSYHPGIQGITDAPDILLMPSRV